MPKFSLLELLAPAKNLEYGVAAINHGADAVYIGAPKFGARSNVGNSITDIEILVKYAHLYGAKVFVTLNTLLFDNELEEALALIHQLYNIGIDALIVQDMGILELNLPPLALHASTQCHNASPEKVLFLEKTGFQRVVLARELSLKQIQNIHLQTNVELEAFIHGALCVSYSGQCYMSHAITGRSGNRGVCSQPCRSAYDLVNAEGKLLKKNAHLLSLKDLNTTLLLPEMVAAGVTSFKIEGRLKDITYLKNITAHYRLLLDNFLENNKQYSPASSGKTTFFFTPDPEKTFNRSYTSHFLNDRSEKVASLLTQKSIGKEVGVVKEVFLTGSFSLETKQEIENGDGLCFFGYNGELEGFQVNKAENGIISPNKNINLTEGITLYRNHDSEFERLLQQNSSERKIGIRFKMGEYENGFELMVTDEDALCATVQIETAKEISRNETDIKSQIIKQLSKLGETPFIATEISIEFETNYFLPISLLNKLRRDTVDALQEKRIEHFKAQKVSIEKNNFPYPTDIVDFTANITNEKAVDFYKRYGVQSFEYGVEKVNKNEPHLLMTTKHCIKYQLEQCPVYFKQSPDFAQQLFLCNNNQIYALEFECKTCRMTVKGTNRKNL